MGIRVSDTPDTQYVSNKWQKLFFMIYSNSLHNDISVNHRLHDNGPWHYKGVEKFLSPSDIVATVKIITMYLYFKLRVITKISKVLKNENFIK